MKRLEEEDALAALDGVSHSCIQVSAVIRRPLLFALSSLSGCDHHFVKFVCHNHKAFDLLRITSLESHTQVRTNAMHLPHDFYPLHDCTVYPTARPVTVQSHDSDQ